jgi:predicted phage tail protein
MIESNLIVGSGGQRKPREAADTLDSTQIVTLIDLISEGEIQGLKDGLKSIFLDGTALQNADGTFNFQNVTVVTRAGTQNQETIPFAPQPEEDTAVALVVTTDYPITRTITDPDIDAARVTISVPQLQAFTSKGDIVGAEIKLQIQVQYASGGYTTVVNDTIRGRSGDLYQKDYIINFTGAAPVDIRVVRITPDSTSSKLTDEFLWSAYTEITYAKLNYPNSALVAIRADADQFSRVPSRAYRVRGIKVRIPSNATVDPVNGRLIYTGIWNGTFGAAQWCSDPAWILWDLLTSTRYGFGTQISASQLDRWAFLEASKYCSELVPNGFSGTEPRFSCNVNIQTQEDAYKLINEMSSVFRAMPFWSTGGLTIAQDKPADTAYLFTLANVSDDGFSYSGSSLKTRPTVAVVGYLDLDQRDTAYEVAEDREGIAKYGVITTEVTAFACTSRGQASRLGEWILYSSRYETEVVTFTTSIDAGVMVRPGQVIEISDPMRAGTRRGGRIVAATTTSITVDDATGLTVSAGARLSVILPDGTVQGENVSAINGNVISVSPAFATAPNANSVWIYQTNNIQTSTWRVLSVQEQDGSDYVVSALTYNASKYDYVERNKPLQQRDVTDLNIRPDPPTNLTAKEVIYAVNSRALSKIIFSWRSVAGVTNYQARWRYSNGNWNFETLEGVDFEINDTLPGVYDVEVYSLSAALLPSATAAKLSYVAVAKSTPPEDVTGIQLIPIDQATATLSWDRATALDVLMGGRIIIRHSPVMVSGTWADSQDIVMAVTGTETMKIVPLLEGTYFLKFEDDTGNRSVNAATVVVDLPAPQPRLLLQNYTEDQGATPFPGVKTDMLYSTPQDALILSTGKTSGNYVFNNYFDVGGVFDVNIRRRFLTRSFYPNSLWDDKLSLMDTWGDIDEGVADATNARLYVQVTPDNPAGVAPVWSAWYDFANSIIQGRGFRFKVEASTTDPDQNILIDELGATLELQQRVEQSGALTSGAAKYTATFGNKFYAAPSMGITAYDMATGDFFTVENVTRSGFEVTFKNSAGTAVSRQFTYTAIGFGREIV